MLWIAKWKPHSKCERTQKMKKKWKLNFQLLSSLKPKNENLEACYGFLSVAFEEKSTRKFLNFGPKNV